MIGSTVADILIHVDHLPSLEEDVEPTGQTMSLGGCCFNVSNMLSFFEVPYTLFSPVGGGIYGTFIREELLRRGMRPVLETDEANGCCYCIIDKDGNRTFLALHGAEYLFRKEWFDSLNMEEYTDVYICGLEIEDKTGDVIVTSGLGGSFFRGIIVGTVVKVDGDASTETRRIVVEPNESTGPLQEVMVITAMNSEGALAPQKTDKGEDGSSEETVESEADAYVEDATVTQDYTADVYYDDGTTVYDDGTTELYYDDGSAALYGDGTGLYDDGSGMYYDETSVW